MTHLRIFVLAAMGLCLWITTDADAQAGSIEAWGDNGSGQLNVPTPNTGFVAIAAGYWHSLGLRANCPADLTGDGVLDFFDISGFLVLLQLNDPQSDFSGDGQFDFFDIAAFLQAFVEGCP